MENVLVTGSCGFIGHHLVRRLKSMGCEVTGVDNLSNGDEKYVKDCSTFLLKDINDVTPEDMEGIDTVFHLAALPRVPFSILNPRETHEANANGTLNLLLAARDAGVKKFVYSSSSAVYGNPDVFPSHEDLPTKPLSPYAVQKLTGELYAEVFRGVYELPTASLRYFNVFGEEQPADNPYTGVVTKFLDYKKSGRPLTIFGDGKQQRDFTYVGDIVTANIMAAEKGIGVYNVGTGKNTSILEVAEAVGGELEYLPERPGDPVLSQADNARLLLTGWKPTISILDWITQQ